MYFTGIIFATISVVFFFIATLWLILFKMDYIPIDPRGRHIPLFIFALGSTLIGTVIAVYVGKIIIRPIQSIENAFDELSRGNFNIKISEDQKIAEIREMAQKFNAMAYDLSHIETLRNDFVANVSHEFKTPISAIEGYATLLQNPNLSLEKHERYVEKILDNSRRLSNMSGNILLLSKLENQETLPDCSEYRLDEQIRKCVLMLEAKWSQKQIEFDIDLYNKYYYGSQSLLDQVWINILDNAIKHSPVCGCIKINMSESNGEIYVCIADEGEGMNDEIMKHIFEKFYQGDSSHKSEGNGLGLALVKRIMDLCHGTVTVKSEVGKGTEFKVKLS